jgi:acyl carrier protein
MVKNDQIMEAIFRAIDDVNQLLPKEERLEKNLDAGLYGEMGTLDSLGLVNLIVATEERIEEFFGILITLADERAMSKKHSPFRTVGTLADHLSVILARKIAFKSPQPPFTKGGQGGFE